MTHEPIKVQGDGPHHFKLKKGQLFDLEVDGIRKGTYSKLLNVGVVNSLGHTDNGNSIVFEFEAAEKGKAEIEIGATTVTIEVE